MALRLLAITSSEGHLDPLPTDVIPVAFGDVVALTSEATYRATAPAHEEITRHAEIVEEVFRRRAVLPAPPGVVFRSTEALERWLELHSVVLADTLAFVEDRVAARVHIRRAEGSGKRTDLGTELSAAAAESMRRLRRQAITSIPLYREQSTSIVLSAAFLVERELWKEFVTLVGREEEELDGAAVELTGPWPPWDFVKMDFGG